MCFAFVTAARMQAALSPPAQLSKTLRNNRRNIFPGLAAGTLVMGLFVC